jgi:hypothetical protein
VAYPPAVRAAPSASAPGTGSPLPVSARSEPATAGGAVDLSADPVFVGSTDAFVDVAGAGFVLVDVDVVAVPVDCVDVDVEGVGLGEPVAASALPPSDCTTGVTHAVATPTAAPRRKTSRRESSALAMSPLLEL